MGNQRCLDDACAAAACKCAPLHCCHYSACVFTPWLRLYPLDVCICADTTAACVAHTTDACALTTWLHCMLTWSCQHSWYQLPCWVECPSMLTMQSQSRGTASGSRRSLGLGRGVHAGSPCHSTACEDMCLTCAGRGARLGCLDAAYGPTCQYHHRRQQVAHCAGWRPGRAELVYEPRRLW